MHAGVCLFWCVVCRLIAVIRREASRRRSRFHLPLTSDVRRCPRPGSRHATSRIRKTLTTRRQLRSPAWTPACICPRNTPACARYARRRVIVWMCCLQFDRGDSDAGVKNKPISSSSSVDKRRPSSSSATVPPRDIPVSEDAEVTALFWLHAGVCCLSPMHSGCDNMMKARRRDYMILSMSCCSCTGTHSLPASRRLWLQRQWSVDWLTSAGLATR